MRKTLKIVRISDRVPMPEYAREGDAGFDIYASERTVIAPMERISVSTGYKMEIPYGSVGIIYEKSGLSFKHGLITYGNVIDAGYRGEIHVGVFNLGKESYIFEPGHKIAQMIIHEFNAMKFKEVKDGELSTSERGEKGFGSTGK